MLNRHGIVAVSALVVGITLACVGPAGAASIIPRLAESQPELPARSSDSLVRPGAGPQTTQPSPTTVVLTPARLRTEHGVPVTVVARIKAADGTPPAGVARVDVDGHSIVLALVSAAGAVSAGLPWSLPVGRHIVGVTYLPPAGSATARSARTTGVLTVVRYSVRSLSLVTPGLSVEYGAASSASVAFGAPHAVPSGVVVLRDGRLLLGRAPVRTLNSGLGQSTRADVQYTARSGTGLRNFTLSYTGDNSVAGFQLPLRVRVVRTTPRAVSVTVVGARAGARGTVRIDVPGRPGVAPPGGRMTLRVDGRGTATGLLHAATVRLALPPWRAGRHQVTATYAGDVRYRPAASRTVIVQVPGALPIVRYSFPVRNSGPVDYARVHHDYPATDVFASCLSDAVAMVGGVVQEVSRMDLWNPATDVPADRGGLSVSLVGDDGVRYYVSHLHDVLGGIAPGVRVGSGQLLGHVGETGNAAGLSCHAHVGMSPPCGPGDWSIRRGTFFPWPYLDSWRGGGQLSPAAAMRAWRAAHAGECAAHRLAGT